MRTVDPAQHAARRRHIAEAAAGCFARNGFDRTTTADICREAGMSSGSLFHYFPSKKAVFLAIFEDDARQTAALLAEAATAADPWAAVLHVLDVLAAPAADPAAPGLVMALLSMAGRDPDVAELLERGDVEACAGLATLLDAAAARGQIDPGVDTAVAAAWVLGLVDTLFLRADAARGFDPVEQARTLRLVAARFLRAPDPP